MVFNTNFPNDTADYLSKNGFSPEFLIDDDRNNIEFEKEITNAIKDVLYAFDKLNIEGELDVKRTIVSFKSDISIKEKQSMLLDFVSYLKNNIDKRLEVFQQMKQDKNKLRDGRLDIT